MTDLQVSGQPQEHPTAAGSVPVASPEPTQPLDAPAPHLSGREPPAQGTETKEVQAPAEIPEENNGDARVDTRERGEGEGRSDKTGETELEHRRKRSAKKDGEQSRTKLEIKEQARIDNFTVIENIRTALISMGPGDPGVERPAPRSLLELTTELPLGQGGPDFAATASMVQEIRENQLLLISCFDQTIAQCAAYAIVDALGIPVESVRLLDFDRLGPEGAELTIHDVLRGSSPAHGKTTVVVVDALGASARTFADSLLTAGGLFAPEVVRQSLRRQQVLMICLTDSEPCVRKAEHRERFTRWSVPFLEPLLWSEFPGRHRDVAAQIEAQRSAGRWSRDEREFCKELRSCLHQGTLATIIEAGGLSPADAAAQATMIAEDKPVHRAALYVGAHLADLNAIEFDRVMMVLLGEETIVESRLLPAGNGVAPVMTDKEIRLTQRWRANADRILRECALAPVKVATTAGVIAFNDARQREVLRHCFETDHTFYMHAKFAALHDACLLFEGSDRISESVARLTATMIRDHASAYGIDWLCARFNGLTGSSVLAPLAVQRGANFLRALWDANAKPTVGLTLQQLMSQGAHGCVLALVKQLRFTPDFDASSWLRQIMDRANEAVRADAYRFVYGEMLSVGPQVYSLLQPLSAWLPAYDQNPRTYSPSNRYALRLMIEYATETVTRVDHGDYGVQPSRCPLLAFADNDRIEEKLTLVVRWLLHPGMKVTLDEDGEPASVIQLLAALVAEWAFILRKPIAISEDARTKSESILRALLGAVVTCTDTAEGLIVRREMLAYWDEMKEILLLVSGSVAPTERALRSEFTWKRQVMHAVVVMFRGLVQQRRAMRVSGVGPS